MDIPKLIQMRSQPSTNFSGILTDLIIEDENIVEAMSAIKNSAGVYYNPRAKSGFQYAAAFVFTDEFDNLWVETFGLTIENNCFILRGRHFGSVLDNGSGEDEIILKASELINRQIPSV